MFFLHSVKNRSIAIFIFSFVVHSLFAFQSDPVNQKPTAICISSLITARIDDGGQVMLYAQDFDLGSFDSETPFHELQYTIVRSGEIPIAPLDGGLASQKTISLHCNGDGTIIDLDMWVWDNFGQGDFCTVNVLLTGDCSNEEEEEVELNGAGIISGQIFTETGDPVNDALVILNSKLPGYPKKMTTNENGIYEFEENELFENYTISVSKDDFHENGITVLDLLLIMQHILNINPFDTVSELVAGDVNNDRKVSAGDLIELRRLVLGIIPSFSTNASWRFANESAMKNLPAFTWPLEELIQVPVLADSLAAQNFIGIKVGDVNFDAQSFRNTPEKNTSRSINLLLPSSWPQNSNYIDLPIQFDTKEELYAFQFKLDIQGYKLLEVISDDSSINDQNVHVQNGILAVAWANIDPYNHKKPMILRFSTSNSSHKNVPISLYSKNAHSVTYAGLSLQEYKLMADYVDNMPDFKVNLYPNPATSEGVFLDFYMPKEQITDIELYSMGGQKIYKRTIFTPTKRNHIFIPGEVIKGHKTLIYRLKSGNLTYNGNFIIID